VAATVIGGADRVLDERAVRRFVAGQLAAEDLAGRSLCVLVPDATRSCPLPLLLDAVRAAVAGRVSRLTVLVALGTHAPLDDAALERLLGGRYPEVRNHRYEDLVELGSVPALDTEVPVRLNRAVVEHDVVLVVGPVFPHEVVGFSGGNKYLVPGVAGPEIIDVSHWLGALITSSAIIGTRGTTPVRALIDAAAALVPARLRALSVVVESGGTALHAMAYGDTVGSWALAADVAAEAHVRYLDRPVRRVLSLVPDRYDEMWTAAKGMYKLEPVVADGGELVVHAPHVHTVSHTHDAAIRAVGYHCRDYFTGQWDRFRHHPWGVLAHSTHLRGTGTWSPAGGERCRITVTLATGLDRATTESLALTYRDPAGIDPAAWARDPGTLVVPNAGEVLYRLRTGAGAA
jgi:nickel-dependent lactate racemase